MAALASILQTCQPQRTSVTEIQIQETFKCLLFGDWGLTNTTKKHLYTPILPHIRKRLHEFAVFVFLGDIVYDLCDSNIIGQEDSCRKYKPFLEDAEFLLSRVPFMPTLGNHEADPRLPYSRLFAIETFIVPGDIIQYSFGVGNVHFQTVDFFQEVRLNNTAGLAKKTEWLQRDFDGRSSRVKWVIPFSHYPMYCKNLANDDGCKHDIYKTVLRPILEYLHRNNVRRK